MSTWKTKIEDVAGLVDDDAFISNVCSEALQEVVSTVDEEHLKSLIVEVATNDSNPVGLPDDSGRLLDVFREDGVGGRFRECKEVPLYLEARIQDGGSIYAATVNEPLFVKKGGNLYVYPAPAVNNGVKVLYFNTDILIAYNDDYDSAPTDFNVALKVPILYKAIHRTLVKLMVNVIAGFPVRPFASLPSPPAPPPELSLGTAGNLDISAISIPLFVPPSLSIDFTNLDAALLDEDEDMATAHTGKINIVTSEYEKLVAEATQQYESSKTLFEKEFDELKQNADKGFERLDKESLNKVELFGKEMDVYKEQIDKEINYFKELISKEKEKYTVYKDTSDIYKELYLEAIKSFLPPDKEETA
tara:strand:- start:15912 stop:16991 length:1080 start_codon:yes stop_codon:yes gene_type:complete